MNGSALRWLGISRARSTSRRSPTWSNWRRAATPSGTRGGASSPRHTSGWCRPAPNPTCPTTPPGIRSTHCRAGTHGSIAESGRARLRAKLSYTTIGYALAPDTFTISQLRDIYGAALGLEVSATNLQRVLLRRGVLVPTNSTVAPTRSGGRPAAVYRFRERNLLVTNEFAAFRPSPA